MNRYAKTSTRSPNLCHFIDGCWNAIDDEAGELVQGGVLVLCGRRVLQEGGLQVRQDLLLVVPDLAQYGRGVRQVFKVGLTMVVKEKSIYV